MSTTTPHTQIAYKDTPIGKIPADWEVKKLGEVVKLSSGKTKPILNNGMGQYPVFGGNGIMGYSESYNYTGETVIIGRVGEYCGITRYVDEPCWITDNALYAKEIAEGVKPIYLAYKLQQLNLSRYRSKGGQPLISQTMINPISLPLPPLSEQKRIAEVLSTWDQAIQLTEQLIRQKEQRKKWLMQNLLTGKMRLKGFSGESQFRVLGKFITEVSDRNKNGEIKNVLSVTNSKGFINQAEQFEREVASADVSNYKIVRKGQFAYNPSRVNVGSLDLLRKFDIGILSPMYVVFETDQKNLIPEYLFYLLKTNWFYGHIPMFVQGSVRDSLSFDGLCGMKFFIPSIEEQTAIAEVLQTAEKEIELRKAKAEKLKEQKKGLMQQLLTGRKRLKIEIKV
jgi:type I restriction enzyme S subunit